MLTENDFTVKKLLIGTESWEIANTPMPTYGWRFYVKECLHSDNEQNNPITLTNNQEQIIQQINNQEQNNQEQIIQQINNQEQNNQERNIQQEKNNQENTASSEPPVQDLDFFTLGRRNGIFLTSDISWIDKIELQLHETFTEPNRVLKQSPFILEEKGWGEFLLFINIFIKDKKFEFKHFLKLFPSKSGEKSEIFLQKNKGIINEKIETIVFRTSNFGFSFHEESDEETFKLRKAIKWIVNEIEEKSGNRQ
ncbi:Transcription initiation factor IIF, auxiliary subunit [Pseudoloma neurophilia]|uniref:Protein AF-9 homolog n=1 Tax=Pseudoloma neurophilia TaxID=146866 RepID=A0A0R0M3D2_9MICR|nr:Transcription initiation factor IIF, auxiliary subunit [Pseudoloma neurophilia]